MIATLGTRIRRTLPAGVNPAPGGTEPADPGAGYLWSDNFDRYVSALAMQTDGSCGGGLPDANATYGQRTMANAETYCDVPTGMSLVTGRGGTGKALRSTITATAQDTYTWLSPWVPGEWGTYSGSLVAQIWFRASAGGSPAPGGCKWFELWYNTSNSRMQTAMVGDPGEEVWCVSNDGRSAAASQPVGPYWAALADGQFHRFTINAKKNTTGSAVGSGAPYSSSRDGFVRVWVDGTKIVDLSAAAAGITPSGGTKAWCTLAEVDEIVAENYERAKFPDVFNDVAAGPWTLDHDDFKVWAIA